jgi:hypothetical protein
MHFLVHGGGLIPAAQYPIVAPHLQTLFTPLHRALCIRR